MKQPGHNNFFVNSLSQDLTYMYKLLSFERGGGVGGGGGDLLGLANFLLPGGNLLISRI